MYRLYKMNLILVGFFDYYLTYTPHPPLKTRSFKLLFLKGVSLGTSHTGLKKCLSSPFCISDSQIRLAKLLADGRETSSKIQEYFVLKQDKIIILPG